MDLSEEVADRIRNDRIFEKFYSGDLTETRETVLPTDFDCLRALMSTYASQCGVMSDYALKYVKYFVIECETENSSTESL